MFQNSKRRICVGGSIEKTGHAMIIEVVCWSTGLHVYYSAFIYICLIFSILESFKKIKTYVSN